MIRIRLDLKEVAARKLSNGAGDKGRSVRVEYLCGLSLKSIVEMPSIPEQVMERTIEIFGNKNIPSVCPMEFCDNGKIIVSFYALDWDACEQSMKEWIRMRDDEVKMFRF